MNNSSLHIGKWLFQELSNINGLAVYPVVASEGTTTPYAVYYRQGITASNTKDGVQGDLLTYNLNIYTDSYAAGLDYMEQARKLLSVPTKYDNMNIRNFAIVGGTEDYAGNIYIQTITFQIKVS